MYNSWLNAFRDCDVIVQCIACILCNGQIMSTQPDDVVAILSWPNVTGWSGRMDVAAADTWLSSAVKSSVVGATHSLQLCGERSAEVMMSKHTSWLPVTAAGTPCRALHHPHLSISTHTLAINVRTPHTLLWVIHHRRAQLQWLTICAYVQHYSTLRFLLSL